LRVEIRHIKNLWVLGVFLLVGLACSAQDPASSQFYANQLFMNPGLAGLEGPTKVSIGYRNQWPGSAGAYSTYHASYEQYLEPLQGGIGVHVMNDRQGGGTFNTMSLDAIYAYHLKVTRQLTLTGGLQASVGQRSMNTDGLVLPDELTGVSGTELTGYSQWYPDFAVGFGAFYKNVYGGIACHHLIQPYMSPSKDPNTKLSRRYSAHIGAMIPVYEKRLGREVLQLSPNLIFLQQDIYQQINYGLEVLFRNLLAGIWIRQDLLFSYGTAIFSVGYARDQFRFRYSYDAKLSAPDLHIPSMGAHEISLAIIFENLYKSSKPRAIKSPKI
jgi:type IX secretion system PorP/SprF family membrane protein